MTCLRLHLFIGQCCTPGELFLKWDEMLTNPGVGYRMNRFFFQLNGPDKTFVICKCVHVYKDMAL